MGGLSCSSLVSLQDNRMDSICPLHARLPRFCIRGVCLGERAKRKRERERTGFGKMSRHYIDIIFGDRYMRLVATN
jgi:hypothetical protein